MLRTEPGSKVTAWYFTSSPFMVTEARRTAVLAAVGDGHVDLAGGRLAGVRPVRLIDSADRPGRPAAGSAGSVDRFGVFGWLG